MIVILACFAYRCFVKQSQPFIELLNAGKATPEHWETILPEAEQGLWHFQSGQSSEAQQILQRYIGAWITSGFQTDGSEKPAHRNYETWDCQAIFESLESMFNCHLTIHQGKPLQTIFALQARNENQVPLKGTLSIRFNPRGGIQAVPIVFRGYLKPDELAAYGFFLFWQSPWLFTIMRCARCGKFAIPQRKTLSSYVRGWHCEKCRNIAGAEASTAATRKSIRDRWFVRAVSVWLKVEGRSFRDSDERVRLITEWVNEGLPAQQRIKRNSITHNLTEIQAEAERRKRNAKG